MTKKMLSAHWNARYAGKPATVSIDELGTVTDEGTLCGYVANDGVITRLLVAFSPDDRREYAAADVELV